MNNQHVIEWLDEIKEVLQRDDCAQHVAFASFTIKCWRNDEHTRTETCEYRIDTQ